MKLRSITFALLAASAMSLGACVSEEGYRQHMDLLYGRHSDDILVNWGPPRNRTPMSNGRELWSYMRETVDERPGYYKDEVRQVTRKYKDKDGVERVETISETYPVWQPPQVFRSVCTTRFVMGAGRVESVSFEGNGCVAEELK